MQERAGHRDRARVARERALHVRELYIEALREQAKAIEQATPPDAR